MKRHSARLWIAFVFFTTATTGIAQSEDKDGEIERLKEMVAALEARITALEAAAEDRDQPPPDEQIYEPADESETIASIPDPVNSRDTTTGSGAERIDEARLIANALKRDDAIAFKGALRYNLFFNEGNTDTKRGETGLDLFRIGAEGTQGNLKVSAEYRFLSYMNTLHHGWIGYGQPDVGEFQLGVSQVPFGILPYAAHNYWFGVPYYMGLADDYDLGVKYLRDIGDWNLQLGFYKNGELGSASDLERISYDPVVTGPDQANEETNQFNARLAYTMGEGTNSVHELGLSLQGGELYNRTTQGQGHHWAAGAHLDSRYKRWNFQFELARYQYRPENPVGVGDSTVRLGGFATSYDVSASGTVGVANVAYNLPVKFPGVDTVLVYNDFSILFKDEDAFRDSMINTTGAAVGIGPVFLYLDLIQARNMVFFGNGSLAGGGNDSWDSRFNLNIGYYW